MDVSATVALVARIDLADDATALQVVSALAVLGPGSVRQIGSRVVVAKSTGSEAIEWAYAP